MTKLKRYHFDELIGDKFLLTGQEMVHCSVVMRQKVGAQIIGCCGDGYDYIAEIQSIDKHGIECVVLSKERNLCDPQIDVTLYRAMVKADTKEVVQKLSEIGVSKLINLVTDYCMVSQDKSELKKERLEIIADESAKQCGRSVPLTFGKAFTFNVLLDELKDYDCVVFAYEKEKQNKISDIEGDYKKIAILIGPEGGFSPAEYDALIALKNVHCVTLGKRILRTDTACVVASALVMDRFEK